MYHDKLSHKKIINRLHYLKSQVPAIEKMMQQKRTPFEIYIQLRAIRSATDKLLNEVFHDAMRRDIVIILNTPSGTIITDLKTLQRLDAISLQWQGLSLKQLTKLHSELSLLKNIAL